MKPGKLALLSLITISLTALLALKALTISGDRNITNKIPLHQGTDTVDLVVIDLDNNGQELFGIYTLLRDGRIASNGVQAFSGSR